jgi:pilus assembly protein TadC
MQPQQERRHAEREKYLVLRFYARVLSVLGFGSLAVGTLFALLVVAFAEMPVPLRISNAFVALLLGGVYFIILRSTAQAIYLLFDVARNSKASRELLEKTRPSAPAPAPTPQPRPAPGD